MDSWRKSQRFIVSTPWQLQAFGSASSSGPRDVVSELTIGSIIEAEGGAASISNGRLHISLPDGRTAYAEAKAFTPLEEWAAQSFNPNVYSTSPTLWKVSHIFGAEHRQRPQTARPCQNRIFCQRHNTLCATHRSRQIQADASKPRTEAVPRRRSGFLRKQIDRKSNTCRNIRQKRQHNTLVRRVKRNSIDPDSENYLKSYHFLHATRIDGHEESQGITRARNHPWYFNSGNN